MGNFLYFSLPKTSNALFSRLHSSENISTVLIKIMEATQYLLVTEALQAKVTQASEVLDSQVDSLDRPLRSTVHAPGMSSKFHC